jgi:replication factor C small subunit
MTPDKQSSNTLWCEKYRPDVLENYVGNEHVKAKIQTFIDDQDIPHLLLAGKPGTGKTTLAKMLIKHIECDYIFINASDENNVDTVRNKIKGFVSTMGWKDKKIVVLDEADYITHNGQAALRNLMETFSNTARFILTCNYQERIIDAVQSRTQSFSLTPPSQKDVAVALAKILQAEGVAFKGEDVKTIVVSYYPDIRKIINTAQLFSKDGELTMDIEHLIGSDIKLNTLSQLLGNGKPQTKFKTIREAIHLAGVREFTEFYSFFYENIDKFPEDRHPEIILSIAEAQYKESFVVDKEINFAALVYKLLECV